MNNENRIKAAQNGDTSALAALLMEHRGIIAAAVTRTVFEPEFRKDVIQNVFLKAVSGINNYKGLCSFSTWIYRIAVNESIDYCRKHGRSDSLLESLESRESFLIDENQSDGLERISKREILTLIGETLKDCPLKEKTAFSLFYYCGYNGKEAAEAMNISEENFYMKLKSARDRIRLNLKKKGVMV